MATALADPKAAADAVVTSFLACCCCFPALHATLNNGSAPKTGDDDAGEAVRSRLLLPAKPPLNPTHPWTIAILGRATAAEAATAANPISQTLPSPPLPSLPFPSTRQKLQPPDKNSNPVKWFRQMIQLQKLHLCNFSAKWEEKKQKQQKRSDARRHKRQQRRATSQGGWGGGRKASKEERIMLATLLSEPNKVPQVISSLLMWGKRLILVTLLLNLISFTKRPGQ